MKIGLVAIVIFLLAALGCGGYGSMSTQPAAAPQFSPAPGTFTSVQQVTLSDSTPGATIYYTLDGSVPTTASTRYVQPIQVLQTTTIRAVATANSYSMSNISTGVYMILVTP
jgi:hypothetical protein